jgi:hypothetical protein
MDVVNLKISKLGGLPKTKQVRDLCVSMGVAMWLRSGLAVPPVTFLAGPLPVLVAFIATALYATIGLAITLRRPEVRTGRILAWVAVIQGLRDMAWGYAALAGSSDAPMPLDPALVTWLNYALTFPLVAALLIMLIVIFPTDRPDTSAGWRVAGSAFVGAVLVIVGTLARSGRIAFVTTYTNPWTPDGHAPLAPTVQVAGYAVLVVAAVLAAMLVVSRYRRADAMARVQLRVFVAATVFLAVMFALLIATSLADVGTRGARDLIAVAFLLGTALMPLAVAAAVVHYRLYAIDRLVSQGFVYGALVAILAGLTAASIQLFTALFKGLTGQSSDAVLILTTLLLVSVITPIRTRLEAVAKRLTHDPPTVRPAIPMKGRTADGVLLTPPEFADPSFVAALDARIRLVVGSRDATSPREED